MPRDQSKWNTTKWKHNHSIRFPDRQWEALTDKTRAEGDNPTALINRLTQAWLDGKIKIKE